ncbi:Uncharacterized protein FWK35_00000525 [Aphis craccivora]|uniref:Uncharacterized protein n=1 Tax=Aphis craccivora TaxID=307492 RepID=A0A6G0ZRT8_APHCR|nr:Uncharacterized protein FWK35_00000525 [Aphis craccivora]
MAINFSRQTLFYLIDVCAQSSVKYQKSLYEMKMNFIPGRTPPHAVHLMLTKIYLYAQCTYRFIHLKYLPCKLVAVVSFVLHYAM